MKPKKPCMYETDPQIRRWDGNMDDLGVEGIYQRMINASKGTGKTISMKAPALSAEFTRSRLSNIAKAGIEGALFELEFPSDSSVDAILERKHTENNLFGYRVTAAADAYPAGYGERSAQALVREDTVHQLKGTFPSALVSLAKLQARVEARKGDVDAVGRIFARMWGLDEAQVSGLTKMHLKGSEQTRMSAMEDRSYHALSGHPAYSGGFRVDMAGVATSSFGDNTPINWQRLRTGAKTVAQLQIQGDEEQMTAMSTILAKDKFSWTMDAVQGSQPEYSRPFPWEGIIDVLSKEHCSHTETDDIVPSTREYSLHMTSEEAFAEAIILNPKNQIHKPLAAMAKLVRNSAALALNRTIDIIDMYSQERAQLDKEQDADFEELEVSQLRMTFTVPTYKVTRATLRNVMIRDNYGADALPDLRSHGEAPLRLNHAEFRASGLTVPMSIPGALHMAVYIISVKLSMAVSAYHLLSAVKDPDPGATGPISVRLRDPRLYDNDTVYSIGTKLFAEEFMGLFEIIVSNVTIRDETTDSGIKMELWNYLTAKGSRVSICPVQGGWRDLIIYLRASPRGWRLYYWARISIGRLQYAMSSTILAPIAAGQEVDFLSLMKSSVKERAARWKAFYQGKYTNVRDKLDSERAAIKAIRMATKSDETHERPDKMHYVPPALRQQVTLDYVYTNEHNGPSLASQKEYQYMVEMQVKAKFFDKMEAVSHNRQISVGVSDDVAHEMLIEFYQARWYSLERRLRKLRPLGKPLVLGRKKYFIHPWGDYVDKYPGSIEDMIDFSMELDLHAWTLRPDYVWKKLRKSIGELWEDISNEINSISAYIEEVKDVMADEQADALLKSRAQDVLNSMASIPAICIPSVGYRAPFTLPVRQLTIQEPQAIVMVPTSASTYIDPGALPDKPIWDDGGDDIDWNPQDDVVDMEAMMALLGKKSGTDLESQMVVETVKYLSLSEIWTELGLGDVPDIQKRVAFGVAFDTDLYAPHLDSLVVPSVLYEDRPKVKYIWASRIGAMKRRLGIADAQLQQDDM